MAADLLDQLAAYGAQEREARRPLDVGGVMRDVPPPADDDGTAPVDVSTPQPDPRREGGDRRPVVTLTAAAMVLAVVGLIAVLAAVRDRPSEAPAPESVSNPPPPPVELFRVNADAAAYWRLTSLVEYDGDRFRLPRRSLERIEGADTPTGGSATVRRHVQIVALEGRLVPAAADLFQASGFSGGAKIVLGLHRDTDTLVADRDLAPGDLFTVVSSRRQPSPDELRATTADIPPDPLLLALPDAVPAAVRGLAAEITADATTAYGSALALQDWFRSEFAYRSGASGHAVGDLERFLEDRAGSAEQFAATYAVMARTIGLPTRVADGFTTGVLDEHGWYFFTTAQSHTWPEVWFDGVGWLPFEPTPRRGIPGAESYTGVPPQQDERTATSTP